MTQQGRAWTTDEDVMIRRMHEEGASRNAIARAVGCSQATLSKRAHSLGLAFDSSRVREGVETRSLDLRRQRQELAALQMTQALRMTRRIGDPFKLVQMGGGQWQERELSEPDPRDQRDLATGAAQLAGSAMRLVQFDQGSAGADAARSMLGSLITALAGHVGDVGDEPADDGDDAGDDG